MGANDDRHGQHRAQYADLAPCLFPGDKQHVERIPEADPRHDEEYAVSEEVARELANKGLSEDVGQ